MPPETKSRIKTVSAVSSGLRKPGRPPALRFDHTTNSLRKSFGVNKDLEKVCQEVVCQAHKASNCTSEMVEKIWHSDRLSLNAKIYAIYRVGMADGVEAGMHHAAHATAKMMALGSVISKIVKK